MRCREHSRSLIDELINVAQTWKIFEINFTSKSVDVVNDLFNKFENCRLKNYFILVVYVNKFRYIVEKISDFSIKVKLDNNFLIYRFHMSLSFNYNSYRENYIQTHDAFKKDDSIKFFLSDIITRFLNIIRNSTIVIVNLTISSLETSNDCNSNYKNEHHNHSIVYFINFTAASNVQNEAILEKSNSRLIFKLIKNCIWCEKDYHIETKCEIKHLELKNKNERKRNNENSESKNNDANNDN